MNHLEDGEPDTLAAGVREILAWADREVSKRSPRCDASGKCCRFKEYGHRLYMSQMEAELLLQGAPAHAIPADENGCPYQVDGLCTRREQRPLGCRVYFCDPTFSVSMEEIMEEGIRRLKELADRHQVGWDYASLHAFLNDPARAGLPTPTSGPDGQLETAPPCENTRHSLPLA